MISQTTTSAQGADANDYIAVVQLVVEGSGIFDYDVQAEQDGAVGGETPIWNLLVFTGVGAPAYSGATQATMGNAPANGSAVFASGFANEPIVITGGSTGIGGAYAPVRSSQTLGTATVGSTFAAGGTIQREAAGGFGNQPFPLGANVFLVLQISGGSHIVDSINMKLREQ